MQYQRILEPIVTMAATLATLMQQDITPEAAGTKATDKDLVTKADRAVELLLRKQLTDAFPTYNFYGEETGGTKPSKARRKLHDTNQFTWVVDPIDGTLSYVMHQPFWCVSVGLWRNGEPVAACICAPVLKETYYAEKGEGAFCNGTPIHVCPHGKLKDSVLSTGFSCIRSGWTEVNNLKYFNAFCLACRGVRRFGSAALDMCYVASGRTDAFWELNLQPYDIGAAWLVLTEAGGVVTDLHGNTNFPKEGILVAPPELHAEMLPYFKDYRRPKETRPAKK